jgi:peptide/nickel transport system substrate-binding protein
MTKLRIRAVIVALCLALAVTGCGAASLSGGGRADTLTISLAMPVDSLDPAVAFQTGSFGVLANIFQTLVTLDPSGKVVPSLATSYKVDAQQRTIEFNLDPEAHFSNGDPVTSSDVAFSARLWKDSKVWGSWYASIEDVSTPDPHTAIVHLSSSGVAVLGVFAIGSASVVPENFSGMSREDFFRKPIGSGPYAVQSAKLSEQIDTSANPHFTEGKAPHFKNVVFKVVPDPSQRLVQFQSGVVDIVTEVSPTDAQQYPKDVLKTSPSFWQDILIVNVQNDRFASPDFRRALSLAIDRQALVDTVYRGEATVATAVEPQVVANVTPCSTCDWGRRDLSEARHLLAQSKYAGQPITITTGGGSTDLAAQALIPMLAEAGINARVEKLDTAAQLDSMTKGEFEVALLENTALAPTPLDPLGFLADSQNFYAGDDVSVAQKAVEMLGQAQDEADMKAASSFYEEWAYSSASVIPLVSKNQIFAVQTGIVGFEAPVSTGFSAAPLQRSAG